ncbi:DNA topoisomerase [Burkholderiales bacterium GJ-E10]|nr:DNA topoisomerase [Burkholderiales bacterium GJ-E10]
MAMRLIIPEKKSLGEAIAAAIGGAKAGDGYIECAGDTVIAWCAGHLLETAKPEEYVAGGYVRVEDLPVIPRDWKLSPRSGSAAKQLKTIAGFLKKATEVVNAGDAGREGQLLVDEVLVHLGWRGKTSRLWLTAMDEASIRKALSAMSDNGQKRPLFEAGLGRQRADWLVSLNGAIAISRNLNSLGMTGKWSVGRVQTPTLALLVDRAREIGNFKPKDFFVVMANLAGGVSARWKPDPDLCDEDGRLLDRAKADEVARQVDGKTALVTKFAATRGSREAPMPFSLPALQMRANDVHGFTAAATLEAAQELYEAKITTYPRTDYVHLPEEQHGDAPRILEAIGATEIPGIDPTRKHAAWNSKKIGDHFAIIPTGKTLSGVSDLAMKVYGLIRESYIRLFLPPEEFEKREASFDIEGYAFHASARSVLSPGWTKFGTAEDEAPAEEGKMPFLREGQECAVERAEVVAKQTSRPKPYTDKTLIGAMSNVYRLVEDPALKARLKETSGLGTPATQSGVIETLVERGYAERKGKEINPSTMGVQLIGMVRAAYPRLAEPAYTALQEDALADIEAGKGNLAAFEKEARELASEVCKALLRANLAGENAPKLETCPACQAHRLASLKSKSGFGYFKCGACGTAFRSEKGQVGAKLEERKEGGAPTVGGDGPKCPKDKVATVRAKTKTEKDYFRCPKCRTAWWPDRDDPAKLGKKWD